MSAAIVCLAVCPIVCLAVCPIVHLAVCHEQGQHAWHECLVHHKAAFICFSLVESELAWLHP